MQKSTTFTTIFGVNKCDFHYDFSCKKVSLSFRYAKNKIILKVLVWYRSSRKYKFVTINSLRFTGLSFRSVS
jgi:hypothetical protein